MPEDRTIFRRTTSGATLGGVSTAARHSLKADRNRSGFTLIDLLVSLSVMTILVTMMLPVLTGAYETARRFRCASNLRQIGLGVQMYADDYGDRLPPSIFREGAVPSDPHDTIFVRKHLDLDRSVTRATWDGVGHLFVLDYLDTPEVFYCPSHHGAHPYDRYADNWINAPGDIVINYQFRILDLPFMTELDPGTSLLADGMRTKLDYNHIDGNNTLKADLSMPWYEDVTRELYLSLPDSHTGALAPGQEGEARAGVINAWKILDTESGRRVALPKP